MIRRYKEVQPWMLDSLTARLPRYKRRRDVVARILTMGEPWQLDLFYLGDEATGWFCPVRENPEMVDFEELLALPAEEVPPQTQVSTIPLTTIGRYESVYYDVMSFFLQGWRKSPDGGDEAPWADFGMAYEEASFYQFVIINPRMDFREWVLGLANNLRPHTFGEKSKVVRYETIDNAADVERLFLRFMDAAVEKSISTHLEEMRRAEKRGLLRVLMTLGNHDSFSVRRQIVTSLRDYLYEELLPACADGSGYITAAKHRDIGYVGITTHQIGAVPAYRYNEGQEVHADTVLAIHDSAELKPFAVTTMMSLWGMHEAFWVRGHYSYDLSANLDERIDRYKMQFRPTKMWVPGLRWLDPESHRI